MMALVVNLISFGLLHAEELLNATILLFAQTRRMMFAGQVLFYNLW